jgi:hypothetical protein
MADIFSGYTKEQIREALPHLTFRERAEFDAIIAKSPAEKNDVLVDAFPEQVAYVLDPAPFKFLFCTRRAAKSFSFGLDCFHDGANWPKGNYLFLGLVREEAKRIFWKDVLKEINEKFKLGAEFNESSLTCTSTSARPTPTTRSGASSSARSTGGSSSTRRRTGSSTCGSLSTRRWRRHWPTTRAR